MSDQFAGSASSPVSGQDQQEGQSGFASSLTGRLKEDMRSATRTVADDLSGLKDNITGVGQSDTVSSLKNQAKSALSEQTEKAKTYADQQKSFLAQQVSGIGQAVRNAADNLEQSNQPTLAGHVRTMAQSLDSWSDSMRNQDLGEIFRSAQDFGRRNPTALIGLAALAGFAASRFLMASNSRNAQSGQTSMGVNRYDASSSGAFGDDDFGSSSFDEGGSTSFGGSGANPFDERSGSYAERSGGSYGSSRPGGKRSDDLGTSVLGGEV